MDNFLKWVCLPLKEPSWVFSFIRMETTSTRCRKLNDFFEILHNFATPKMSGEMDSGFDLRIFVQMDSLKPPPNE